MSGVDGGTDGGGSIDDGGTPTEGLLFTFKTVPEQIPGTAGGQFQARIRSAEFKLSRPRAIGDAAPGDSRTTRAMVELEWGEDDDDSESASAELVFPRAPAGIYSWLRAEVVEYEISGTVTVDVDDTPTVVEFEVEDEPPGDLSLEIDLNRVELPADIQLWRIAITVDLANMVVDLPWDDVPADGEGKRVVDRASEHIDDVRDDVTNAFTSDDDNDDNSLAM